MKIAWKKNGKDNNEKREEKKWEKMFILQFNLIFMFFIHIPKFGLNMDKLV